MPWTHSGAILELRDCRKSPVIHGNFDGSLRESQLRFDRLQFVHELQHAALARLDLARHCAVESSLETFRYITAASRARLGAIDAGGGITDHGRKMAAIALPPPLAHMLVIASATGQGERAAMLALLLQERGLGGAGEDLEARLERFVRERGARAAGPTAAQS